MARQQAANSVAVLKDPEDQAVVEKTFQLISKL